jgi:hypothetical protein
MNSFVCLEHVNMLYLFHRSSLKIAYGEFTTKSENQENWYCAVALKESHNLVALIDDIC